MCMYVCVCVCVCLCVCVTYLMFVTLFPARFQQLGNHQGEIPNIYCCFLTVRRLAHIK